MFDKRLAVPLCDFRSRALEELSPLGKSSFLISEEKTNMNDRNCQNEVSYKEESEEENKEMEEEDKRDVKKKIVKIIGVKPKEHLLLDEENESNESDEDSYTGDMPLSAYERMIERNRAQRMAVLKSLKIDEIKSEFCEAVKTVKKKTQPVKRKYTEKVKTSPPILRKSRRLANLSASVDLSEHALFMKAIKEAKETVTVEEIKPKRRQPLSVSSTFSNIPKKYRESEMQEQEKKIPPKLTFKEAIQCKESYEDYCKNLDIQNPKANLKSFSYDNFFGFFKGLTEFLTYPWKQYISPTQNSQQMSDGSIQGGTKTQANFVTYDKSIVKSLTLHQSNIAKITPGRITAVAWHPLPDNLIFAAGDKYGNLGIWKVDSESNPYVFKTHRGGTTNLMFNPLNPSHLVSSSYEGTLRCGDMVKHVFYEVYNVSDETCCTYFDFLSQTTYLIAQIDGKVALVDDRAGRKQSQKKHTCHEHSIKTIHVHPANKNVFVTAENRGPVRLWDLRKLQKEPVADIQFHKRCTSSAYFSPITGNSILTTSLDDSLSIFDSTNLTKDIKLKKSMSHNNYTGRWLSVFRAVWLPNSEDAFVIGSMDAHRRIEVYDKNMNVYHIIKDENLCTITSLNIFHPNRPALAGANSSGKVVIFTTR